MGGWKQVAGDVGWERHGIVLARHDTRARQVELVRITPWIEHDKEAAVSHGLYLVDSTTFDVEDLLPDARDVRSALRSVGMDEEDYVALAPEHQAEIISGYRGYEESQSVDALSEALPAPAGEITFWSGKESTDKLVEYDRELRQESLEANFETRLSFGVMPDEDALTFALGGEAYTMTLQGQDALALEYAMTVAGVPGDTDTPEAFAETVRALADAPTPIDLEEVDENMGRMLAKWEQRYGDPSDEEGIAAAAQGLAASMMQTLGFEWV